jgi:hypothetical protein
MLGRIYRKAWDVCEKCAFEKRIARYKKVADRILDQPALSSITLLIEQCEMQKARVALRAGSSVTRDDI